jgi:hypothetical protein
MYGAYWCTHCYDQKQVLGYEVTDKYLEYIECDKKGNPSPDALDPPHCALSNCSASSVKTSEARIAHMVDSLHYRRLKFPAEAWQQW